MNMQHDVILEKCQLVINFSTTTFVGDFKSSAHCIFSL